MVFIGDMGDDSRGLERPDVVALELESERRRISSRMPSRETFRSEYVGAVDSSSHSVNLEEVITRLMVASNAGGAKVGLKRLFGRQT